MVCRTVYQTVRSPKESLLPVAAGLAIAIAAALAILLALALLLLLLGTTTITTGGTDHGSGVLRGGVHLYSNARFLS